MHLIREGHMDPQRSPGFLVVGVQVKRESEAGTLCSAVLLRWGPDAGMWVTGTGRKCARVEYSRRQVSDPPTPS